MSRLWGRVIVRHRIRQQITLPCAFDDVEDVVQEMCRQLDIPCPLWLNKNVREFDSFRRTAFVQDNFMENIPYDRFEIEFLDDLEKTRQSRDPRNAF